ncbi:hypothetical protein BDV59DRAFT_202004 [Aspergillus ambiguus]|uniref:uncharacterized protein n=1 Tax=Aspergillus ambiguus TaxID=176160 RepID=UPI003CCDD627
MPSFIDSPIPPHLDLAAAPSQLFQVPPAPSASSALYRSIALPPSSRKRSRASPENSRSWLGAPVDRRSPTPFLASALDDDDADADAADVYRPSRYPNPPRPYPLDTSLESLSDIGDLRCKRTRRDPSSSVVAATPADEKALPYTSPDAAQLAPVRWSRAVLNVVGKVWDFCWSGAFRGFYAGGGRGYPLTVPTDEPFRTEKPPVGRLESTPIPGEYPEENDLRRNWVMVSPDGDHDDDVVIAPSSRTRRVIHRRTPTSPSYSRRRAATKRTFMSHPSTISTGSQFAPPAKPHESPVSVETQRYMAERRRMEREEDASLRRLNRQLQAMIREGKQALGTRVEVDDFMEE